MDRDSQRHQQFQSHTQHLHPYYHLLPPHFAYPSSTFPTTQSPPTQPLHFSQLNEAKSALSIHKPSFKSTPNMPRLPLFHHFQHLLISSPHTTPNSQTHPKVPNFPTPKAPTFPAFPQKGSSSGTRSIEHMIRSKNGEFRTILEEKLGELAVNKAGIGVIRKPCLNWLEIHKFLGNINNGGRRGEKSKGEADGDEGFAEGGVGGPNGVNGVR
ncbi:hypothetical protein ACH5RR_020899 [Cinchona calisaya]|uniref:Uncharacterized protein n=1 Tax=Cinchona calisaya TaxID=153742 RepID=A0ABD2ZJ90_9GENT